MTKVDRVALFTAMTSIVIALLLSVALPPVEIPKPIDSVSWRVLLVLPIAVALASPLIIGLGRLVFLLPAFLASISVVFTGLAAIAIYESLNVTLDHVDPKSHSVEVLSKQITSKRGPNSYRLTFRMEPNGPIVEASVPRHVYEASRAGKPIRIRVGDGYLGTPWIESFTVE